MNKLFVAGGVAALGVTTFALGTTAVVITQAEEVQDTQVSQTWEEHQAEMQERWEFRQKMQESVETTVEKTDNGIVITKTTDDEEVLQHLYDRADEMESGEFQGGPRGDRGMGHGMEF